MTIRGRRATAVALATAVVALFCTAVATSTIASAADGPTVSMGNQSGLERDNPYGSVFMPVTLSAAATEPVVVSYYTVNQTAIYIPPEDRTDPEIFGDYQRRGTPEIPRSVTIPAGQLQGTINVLVNIDDEIETDETFDVVISSVSGADAVIGTATGTATIVDSDGFSATNPAITVSSGAIHEGDSGQRRAQFQIHLSRAPVSNVTISYSSTDGTATAPGDYTPKLPGTVTFAAGQISKTIDVLVASNTDVGANRQFALTVAVTGGSPVEEITMTGTATIVDDDAAVPLPVVPVVSAGNNHTCALTSDGVVRCWGDNAQGQLGTGDITPSLTPVTVTALGTDTVDISAGDSHTCAVSSAGGVTCWGNNLIGQLGDGTSLQQNLPVQVVGLESGVSRVESGDNHTCAALAAGGIKCWGWGTNGQLGHNANSSSAVPVDVQALPASTVVSMAAGFQHSCAVFDDGSTRCWGRNTQGQLGNGANDTRVPLAVQPVGLDSSVTDISAGGVHTCAVQSGLVRCFGLNNGGQLGNGLTANSNVPVATLTLLDISAVVGGGAHSCALTNGGGVKCWGLNQEGELGINNATVPSSPTPLDVNGLSTGQISISSGVQHVCSMATDESVRCWGTNVNGQLGNGFTVRSFTPVPVTGL